MVRIEEDGLVVEAEDMTSAHKALRKAKREQAKKDAVRQAKRDAAYHEACARLGVLVAHPGAIGRHCISTPRDSNWTSRVRECGMGIFVRVSNKTAEDVAEHNFGSLTPLKIMWSAAGDTIAALMREEGYPPNWFVFGVHDGVVNTVWGDLVTEIINANIKE